MNECCQKIMCEFIVFYIIIKFTWELIEFLFEKAKKEKLNEK